MAEIFKDIADVERMFREQSYLVQRTLLQKGAKEGAELIRQRAEELAPRDTGELAESEMIKVITGESSAAEVVIRIGPAKNAFPQYLRRWLGLARAHRPSIDSSGI